MGFKQVKAFFVDYSILSDEALVQLIAHRKIEALSALYDRYSRLVYSLALHAVGDGSSAEEITQDVFFRIWEKANTYRVEQAKVSTWLSSITRYRSIDLLRQRGVRPEGHSVGWDEIPLQAARSEELAPEEAAELSMARARVRAALGTLPGDQQKALSLAYFQGLTQEEIAQRLGEPLGTVKTRIRLGMMKLRDLLKEDLPIRK